MRQRTILVINTLASTGERVVSVGLRFLLIPFMIGIMGRAHYGLWIIVGQILAYTFLIDMGLRSAVAREVARCLGAGEEERINGYVNTAAAYYACTGLLVALFTVVVAVFFPYWFEVEPQYRGFARAMVLIVGLVLAVGSPLKAYAVTLAGLQRYDIVAGTHALTDLIRAGVIFFLLAAVVKVNIGWGLVLLAVVSAGCDSGGVLLRMLIALRLCKPVKVQPWIAERKLVWGMLAFGINSVLFAMALPVGAQFGQIMIGALVNTSQAADFSVAVQLLAAGHVFVATFGMSTRVVASKYEGAADTRMLRHLLLRSTRYGSWATLSGLVVVLLFCAPLLQLWVGKKYAGADGQVLLAQIAGTCRVLALGYGCYWLMLPGFNVVNGMGRHRVPAIMAVLVGVVSMCLVALLAGREEATISSVAWGVVLPVIPIWVTLLPWYCCREVSQQLGKYAWEGFILPALGCIPTVVVACACNHYHSATTWWTLGWELVLVGAVALLCGWCFVLAPDDRRHMFLPVERIWRRVKGV